MSDHLKPFLFEGEAMVRLVDTDGAPWFMLADVCHILDIANPTRAASRLDDDERTLHTVKVGGAEKEVNFISESGLYSLTLTSRKPAAKRFKKWVTSEVLPALRRTGTYTLDQPMRGEPVILPKPYDEWSLDEIRTHLSAANAYRHNCNTGSAWWYMMRAGFPRPPERLMPAGWQGDFDLGRRPSEGRSVTIIVPQGGGEAN